MCVTILRTRVKKYRPLALKIMCRYYVISVTRDGLIRLGRDICRHNQRILLRVVLLLWHAPIISGRKESQQYISNKAVDSVVLPLPPPRRQAWRISCCHHPRCVSWGYTVLSKRIWCKETKEQRHSYNLKAKWQIISLLSVRILIRIVTSLYK